jgi:HlyD family secretion protein
MKRRLNIAAGFLLIGVAGALFMGACSKSGTQAVKRSYEFTTIGRGSIEKTVSATGTLEAVSEVDVLAQMSGRVEKVYADYNQRVKKGQLLVKLNTDMLKLQAEEEQAAVRKAQANYDLQLLNYQNQQKLAEKGLVSDYDFKSSKTTLDVNAAELASAQSALKVIETEINQYAFITSPIDGIVLDRDVEEGTSVVSSTSSSASALFTLAEDLSLMDIKTEVDELDIAAIRKGQEAKFTVEALPSQTFRGTVSEVRLVPKTSENVVSYYVIVRAKNVGGKLLPGMTAQVDFIEQSKKDILVVPNAALRFQPSTLTTAQIERKVFAASLAGLSVDQRAEELARYDEEKKSAAGSTAKKSGSSGLAGLVRVGGGLGGPGGPGERPSASARKNSSGESGASQGAAASAETQKRTLWYLDEKGEFQVIQAEAGVSNGTSTEISGEGLEGRKVILKEKVS